MPSLTIVTPKGNVFPVPMDINLGDRKNAQPYLEEHLLNFTKGILSRIPMGQDEKDFVQRYDADLIERLGNTRSLTKGNFADTVLSPDLDVVVLVYSSDKKNQNIEK